VVIPSNPADAKGLLIQAIRDDDPVVFLEHKMLYDEVGEVPDRPYTTPFGEARVVREGKHATVIALGRMVGRAETAKTLASEGIQVTILDPRTTSPLDTDTILEFTEETGRVVVVDEASPRCGMAADIAALIAEEAFDALEGADPQGHAAPHPRPLRALARGRLPSQHGPHRGRRAPRGGP
jgi:pyruvate dehydrogenase E1 component beta subunit